MNTTTLKISKSNVMKRAWSIFKGTSFYSGNFSLSLERAWEVEKENLAYNLKKQREVELFISNNNYNNEPMDEESIAQERTRALTEYYNRSSYAYYAD